MWKSKVGTSAGRLGGLQESQTSGAAVVTRKPAV